MGSVVYTCTDLTLLADRLAKDIQGAGGDPLTPIDLIVPHPLTGAWLRRRIARTLGVALNLRIDYPERGLWAAMAECDPNPKTHAYRVDRPELELLTATVLLSSAPDDPDLLPLLDYCGASGTRDPRFWRRLWQLSCQLTEGFLDCEQHMPGMVEGWVEGRLTDPQDPIERAQAEVYRRALLNPAMPGLTLGLYTREALSRLQQPPIAKPGLFIFGFSLFSQLQLRVLAGLARVADVLVYYAPPARLGEAPEASTEEAQRVLTQWGRAGSTTGRQLRHTLIDTGRYDWVELPEAPRGTAATNLALVQAALRGAPVVPPRTGDDSFRIMSASSPYREAEAIRDDILVRLEEDDSLVLDDCLVLVADPTQYALPLTSVFSASSPPIPHNVIGLDTGGASVYSEAVISLFQVATTQLGRQAAFGLLGNPCFLEAMGLSHEHVAVLASWAESLGVYHSWDKSFRAEHGYGSSERFTWRHGLRRLRLGQIMEPAATEEGPFAEYPPFRDLEAGDRETVAAFDEAVEGLLRAVAGWSRPNLVRPASDWARDLAHVLDTYLAVPADQPEEEEIAASVREGLQALEKHLGDTPIGLTLVSESILARLGSAASRSGRPLDGVTITRLAMPLAVPPFKVIYIAGFNELAFPGAPPRHQLDLRWARLHSHDQQLWPPDHNRLLGMQAIHAAQSALRISTLARDLQKDEELFPSPMLSQLMRLLGWLDAEGEISPKLHVRIPLHAFSRDCLDDASPVSTRSVWDQVLGWNWLVAQDGVVLHPALAAKVQTEANRRLKVREPFEAPPQTQPTTARISLGRLVRLLEEPLTETLRHHRGLSEDAASEAADADHEPLQATYPHDYSLHVNTLSEYTSCVASDTPADLREIAAKQYTRLQRQGKLPEGALGNVDRDHRLAILDTAGQALQQYLNSEELKETRYVRRLILGGARSREVPGERVGATLLKLPNGSTAELRGSVEHWWVGDEEVHALRIIWSRELPGPTLEIDGETVHTFPRDVFLPYLMASALLLNGDAQVQSYLMGKRLVVHLLPRQDETTAYAFGPLDPPAVAAHLQALCEDCLDPTLFELLPFALVASNADAWRAVSGHGFEGNYRDLLIELIESDPHKPEPVWRVPERLRLIRNLSSYVPGNPPEVLRRRITPIYTAHVRGGQ